MAKKTGKRPDAASTGKSHLVEEFGVKRMTPKHPLIRRLKKDFPTSIHGDKFWSSSYLLMDYLQDYPPQPGTRILELGCGWGLTAIYCAREFDCYVTGVDADPDVFPYFKAHAELNNVIVSHMVGKFEDLDTDILAHFDLIIGGDICFWDELTDVLFDLLNRASDAGVRQAIIADPERQPFTDLCDRLDDHFTHEVWDWELPRPTAAHGDILIAELST